MIPTKLEDLKCLSRLTEDQTLSIGLRVPAGCPTKSEVELLIQSEGAIASMDLERGFFSHPYYSDYVSRMIPHQTWQKKPIQLAQSQHEEVV